MNLIRSNAVYPTSTLSLMYCLFEYYCENILKVASCDTTSAWNTRSHVPNLHQMVVEASAKSAKETMI